ncbi:L-threonine ammonia-lyase isoform X2 [Tribolium castaneum]|uniref:L-serine deaminase n=1 Tax=Tribolium castaneum TaxID=7070 RepID=D6WSN2_TRICA|nr:PREDICTED: L-threonine ammonia-lyase isoform X2 [Tribolium castaneum]EFA05892.1 L-threonine dehydratase catabolic TdcB-like Protein [Tribolium castaneum]|eukprot:XP_970671.3 PREDICTED: L-threonine ammonia-lyase isoform X2 [Tribolium castaneum]
MVQLKLNCSRDDMRESGFCCDPNNPNPCSHKNNGALVEDPSCNPDSPLKVTFEEITSAAYKIKSGIINTPCPRSHMSHLTGMDVYLKKDFLQNTGSFKERGARYAMLMLSPERRQNGVIAASLGNHAQAVCYHGYLLGIPVTVVMPIIAPIMKIQKCKEFNANVIMEGKDMAEAKKIAIKMAKEKGYTYINGYDHPQIIAGQGTIALEILEQVEDIDAIVVPTGGGGLLAGVAVAVKTLNPKIKIIGVESERCASFSKAMDAEKPVSTAIEGTLADGLAVPMVGYNAWETAKSLVDKMVVVKEEWIAVAILRMVELEKCVVEGAGAVGLAAILAGQLDEFKGKRVVLILSGGNIDTTILGRCLERGLAADGRLVKCKVTVSDRPGGISELCKLIGSIGVSIKDVIHERAWVTSDVFSVEVKVVCETRDYAHSLELRELLFNRYKKVKFENLPDNLAVSSTSDECIYKQQCN